MDDRQQKVAFTKKLLDWHRDHNTRQLPWKEEKDPYKIWLSEIILQQTRAQQGLPYYLNFTDRFPAIGDLAAADEQTVFRMWQGLGYYNRCRNMIATAKHISNNLNGIFPNTYDSLLSLKGIGPYTAAAIASFAYGKPHAVVDGNVYRVLARYFGIETPFDIPEGKKQFAALAEELLEKNQSSAYNQAIMDLGATVCTPAAPDCDACPLQTGCHAYRYNLTQLLPVRSKKVIVTHRYFHYLILLQDGKIWVRKREGKDIWQNLYEPYLLEADHPMEKEEIIACMKWEKHSFILQYDGVTKQRLTHQIIEAHFYTVHVPDDFEINGIDGMWIKVEELKKVPLPKTLVSFFEKKLYF